MSSTSSTVSNPTPSKYIGGCPYIGMFSDPQTHVGVPDSRNCCHLIQPPLQIKLSYQHSHCLGGGFPECPVYKTSGEAPVSMEPFEDEDTVRKVRTGRLFAIRRAEKANQDVLEEELADQEPDHVEQWQEYDYPPAEDAYAPTNTGKSVRKKLNNSRWLAIAVAILLLAIVGVWWGINRTRASNETTGVLDQATDNPTLSVALQDIGTAEHALKTAEGVLLEETLSAAVKMTEAAQPAVEIAFTSTPSPEPPTQQVTLLPTLAPVLTMCDSIDLTLVEFISGPQVSPVIGSLYKPGSPKPQAVWAIKNASGCSWNEILLWSVKENKVVQPIISKQGQVFSTGTPGPDDQVLPGELIEVALEFNPFSTIRIDNEWVLVINGLSLFGQPRLDLTIENWLTFPLQATPTPTPKPRPKPSNPQETPPPRP